MLSVVAIFFVSNIVYSYESPASDRGLKVVPLIPDKREEVNAAKAITDAIYKTTSSPAFDKINSNGTSTSPSRRICQERIFGFMFGICQGCFIEADQKMELNNQHGDIAIIPWGKLNETGTRCCDEKCSLADIKKLCCDSAISTS
uniref:Uncharacterized protein n=1 Tax=Plectus sambesii TaxID=2011161 RepID=A0A914XUN0_9BILA